MSRIREKESLESGKMHIWALKTQKVPGPLRALTPAATFSLGSWDPLDQILDPHLRIYDATEILENISGGFRGALAAPFRFLLDLPSANAGR